MNEYIIPLIVMVLALGALPWWMRNHSRRLFLGQLGDEIRENIRRLERCRAQCEGQEPATTPELVLADSVLNTLRRMSFSSPACGREELEALAGAVDAYNERVLTPGCDPLADRAVCEAAARQLAELLQRIGA